MEDKDFYYKNGNLQLESIYHQVEKFFFEKVNKNQQALSSDFTYKPALFNKLKKFFSGK